MEELCSLALCVVVELLALTQMRRDSRDDGTPKKRQPSDQRHRNRMIWRAFGGLRRTNENEHNGRL